MFAVKLSNAIYHLLQRTRPRNTLCGLRVSRMTSARDGDMYPAAQLPPGERVCKHCRRISQQDIVGGHSLAAPSL
jgi:hypothetical protein